MPWTVRPLGGVEVLDALPARPAARRVEAALADVVAAEGPVQLDRLGRLVGNAFGLARVSEARKAAILRHLPASVVRDDTEAVVWPPGRTAAEWTGYRRTPEGVDRPLEHVPLQEIGNAMVSIARASAGMGQEELRRVVLGVFGGRRLTASIADRLDAALELAVRAGRLVVAGGTVAPRAAPGRAGAAASGG